MKRLIGLILSVALVCIGVSPVAVSSAPLSGPQFLSVPIVSQQANQDAIITNAMGTAIVGITFTGTYCASGCTSTVVAGQAPNVFIGIMSLSASANTGTIKCWDNYTAGSGTLVAEFVTPGAAGGTNSSSFAPFGGILLANGLTCQMSTAASVADGIMVLYR